MSRAKGAGVIVSDEKNPGAMEKTADSAERKSGSPGKLLLCATPIGNLEDITFRVVKALREADLIAAEDTRNSIRLLSRYDIHTPMTSYHEYNKYDKADWLVGRMMEGKTVACITDAGTPGISDPGEVLVRKSLEAGIQVSSLPGPAACVTALTMSGLPTRRFCFEAFLPPDKKEREEILEELRTETRTIVLYEAPHHLRETLRQLRDALGGDRQIRLCRELTKIHESVFAGTLDEAIAETDANAPRGEYVLVIAGIDRRTLKESGQKSWQNMPAAEHVAMYEQQGLDRKEAMKRAARDRGVSKRDLYAELLKTEGKE